MSGRMWCLGTRWHLVSSVFSILYSCVAIYLLGICTSLFAVHPFLMLIGFVLMANGIQIFHVPKSLTLPWKQKIKLHWIIQATAGLAVILGFLCVYAFKVSNGKKHFTTWHGIVGLATCICLAFTMTGGVSNLYGSQLMTTVKPYVRKTIHKYFGLLTFLIGLSSIGIGFVSTWAENELNAAQRFVIISLLFPFGISVIYLASK